MSKVYFECKKCRCLIDYDEALEWECGYSCKAEDWKLIDERESVKSDNT